MTSSAKASDFLSELKATLSKLTARDESDSAQNGTDRVEAAQEMAAVDRSRYQNDGNADRRADRPGETGGGLCRRSVLYGELSSVLEKRGQQQQQRRQLSDLESRLKPGKSIVYLGSGPRRDALLAAADAATPRRKNDGGGDAAVTSAMTSSVGPRAEEEEDEEDTTDVTSTSSGDGGGGGGASPAGEHGNRDSACVMSADDSASDCSLLIADPPPPQQQPQSEDAEKCRRESVSTAPQQPQQQQQQQQVMAVLSDEEDACRRRRDRQRHFATFPLIRPAAPTLTPPPASRLAAPDDQVGGTRSVPVAPIHDDVITTLMITHSGEPISVGLSHHDPIQVGVSDM